ncbi:MAG: hypothetical protein NUW23_15935 [Firmicutes bacterium]|jgi:hypothetical protein|nr:hypothetical protein [Bacillota bacterium]
MLALLQDIVDGKAGPLKPAGLLSGNDVVEAIRIRLQQAGKLVCIRRF